MCGLRIILITMAAMIALTEAIAQNTSASSGPLLDERAVQADQPHCTRWTDGCVNCARGADGSTPVCSNISVVCQPKPIRCLPDAPAQDTPQSK